MEKENASPLILKFVRMTRGTIIDTVTQKPMSTDEWIVQIEGLVVGIATQEPVLTEGQNEEALAGVAPVELLLSWWRKMQLNKLTCKGYK